MLKNWLGLFIVLMLVTACNHKPKTNTEATKDSVIHIPSVNVEEENKLEDVINRFVRAYSNKDNAKANMLIHPELGIYIIYRPGVADSFTHTDSLDFSKPIPTHFDYPNFSTEYALTFQKLPTYDCGTEKWDKLGFICDTTSRPKQLSNIVAFEEEFNEQQFSDDDVHKIEISEQESYRIIVTADIPLIFHVRKYKGNWYVTTLDRAYAGCDA